MCAKKALRSVSVFLLSLLPITAAHAQTRLIQGRPVTGVNRLLGQPVFELGPFGGAGFNDVAAYNPQGVGALPLTSRSPSSTVLASTVDPGFLDLFHVDPNSFDPAKLNIPLRDVGVFVDPTGKRQAIRDIFPSAQMAPSRAAADHAGPVAGRPGGGRDLLLRAYREPPTRDDRARAARAL
jgi:hypothetical protein